jgi:hypothetical protein
MAQTTLPLDQEHFKTLLSLRGSSLHTKGVQCQPFAHIAPNGSDTIRSYTLGQSLTPS